MSKVLSYVLAVLTVLLLVFFVVTRQVEDFSLDAFSPYQDILTEGIGNTLLVSFVSLLGSLVLGFVFYLFSVSKVKYLNALTDVFTEIIYGTPLLVLVVVTAFLIGPAFGTYNRNLMGYIALIIYMTPYMKNVYKSAFSSISKDQYLTMDLFGFTPYQRFRFIIIPQVTRILMPPMMNNLSMIIKGSALLNVLSYNELYYAIRVAQSQTFRFVEGYILLWILYLMITIPLSQAAKYIERKWSL
ncbi:Inner membrane amino-acid ABC transporter permease protein yecS [Acholeplasma oculi]|uniref:Glutamine ABC transport system, permease protein GlnP n=1 Tax=Acholeplasma oculi TaxID=35623 RepID=A0A061AA85_9MOLU|nr:amino acid ABC transporter permease [Acholeplasma oculi]CDR30299.1 Glutamine ABC transport system, permease protein GlnP [Acholeplasma oculi]SKC43234.1 polar amino acid transport system permease protein [Acholeplasma oculi]SUT88748.1 Inner membrane amino-acid ABC transporter permease protein yecS [Acholeplasma oculi]